MFDALTHLYRCDDPAEAIQQALKAGVTDVLLAGIDPPGWTEQRALAGSGIHLAYGLHPWSQPTDLSELSDLLTGAEPVVAVGEIGLDRTPKHRHRVAEQEAMFLAQLDLARQHHLPVILHVVRAHGLALRCFDRCPAPGGMVHGFTGPPEIAREWLRRGLYLSFGRHVETSRRAQESAVIVPLDRLLVETDAPDQLPGSHHLPAVLTALADLRRQPAALLAQAAAQNARRLLGLPPR